MAPAPRRPSKALPKSKATGVKKPTPVEATKHVAARRKNIPTAELESFAAEDERAPKTVLYPRNPDLDPQLVWRGKDEQDSADLAVPAVPIYIQEKISPQAIIEDLRAKTQEKQPEALQLFSDFNGLSDFQQKVDFYRHDQHWTNRMILGDALLAMTSLAEKEGLKGHVQMVYIDPPYGIRFGSNWQVSTRRRDVRDGRAEDATREPEVIRAFRDTWERGIHSYLAYLRDRLVVARDLLAPTGSVFVQMNVENEHLIRSLLDEVFGAENFCGTITYQKTAGMSSPTARVNVLASVADFLLWYARDRSEVKYRQLFVEKAAEDAAYSWVELANGDRRRIRGDEVASEGARAFTLGDLTSMGYAEAGSYPFEFLGKIYRPGPTRHWTTTREGMRRLAFANRIVASAGSLRYVRYLDEFPLHPLDNVWTDVGTGQFTDAKVYVVQTNTKVVERCILMTTDPGDLVLDPTCGGGTTAYVAEQWGRRWITIDTSRVALALARTRLMAGRYPYYLLSDSPAGQAKEAELSAPSAMATSFGGDVRKGFIHQRVPHVTLRSIANNPDISEGLSREEIDRALAHHAETELLQDRPFEDRKTVRVAGPFTVESLSPHRSAGVSAAASVDRGEGRFVAVIIDSLRIAGVQNTVKNERLQFESLDLWPGEYVQAVGDYVEDGKIKRAAVTIGPEYGTVDPELVRQAAKEAVRFADLLVVCGFAFDPHVTEDAMTLGKLTVLKAKMNPDLAMGDELLKKTGTGNLFMVFGEPDIDVRARKDGEIEVEIRGLDVYDPTTGQVRNSSTDDIATWFIDTDYDGESFFVRHAYFIGADDPYEQLKRALRADIDEEAWASLSRTVSRPFPRPGKGKIAVKVINHYGDEILTVYPVG